jgi:hypothetical protein
MLSWLGPLRAAFFLGGNKARFSAALLGGNYSRPCTASSLLLLLLLATAFTALGRDKV